MSDELASNTASTSVTCATGARDGNIPDTILGCLYKCFPILTADLKADVICPAGTWHSWDLKPGS